MLQEGERPHVLHLYIMHTFFDSIHILKTIFEKNYEIAACIINVWGFPNMLPNTLLLQFVPIYKKHGG